MFPLFSSTQHYRLQHIAHHQFVNDPERDPDVSQLQTSGHWLNFPVEKKAFLATLLKQLWLPNLFRFMRIRARIVRFNQNNAAAVEGHGSSQGKDDIADTQRKSIRATDETRMEHG